jgi:N-acetylneuraminic acid mutarotase
MPDPPVKAGYEGFVEVWSGTELLVFATVSRNGTQGPILSGVGAAYDPARNTWRKLPAFPYQMYSIEGGTRAVWDGTEMLIWGQADGAYNPTTNRWRPLHDPLIGAASITLWTGRQVIMWGGGCCDSYLADGATYDISHDAWTRIPASPLAGRHSDAVWTGTEMVTAGGFGAEGTFLADAAAYNPSTRTWRRLPSLPAARAQASITWTGSEVVIAGGFGSYRLPPYADAMAYNPATNRWRRLADMPDNRHSHCAAWTGDQLLVFGGQTTPNGKEPGSSSPQPRGWSYDPTADRWSKLPAPPPSAHSPTGCAWTGSSMIVLSSDGGAIYTPR